MTDRIILGAFDGTYVLRASRPGFDVTNPNLPKEALAFDSRWNTVGRIVQTGIARGTMVWVDMLGTHWSATIDVPPDYPGVPHVLYNSYPDFDENAKVQSGWGWGYPSNVYGDLSAIGGGQHQLIFGGEPVWTHPDVYNLRQSVPFGYFRYFLIRMD